MRTSKRWTAWILAVLLISCIAVPAGMAAPAETGPVVITLDPGHGGPDSGAVANGRKESDLNLTICQYIKQYLEEYENVEVYMTRTTREEGPELEERIKIGVSHHSDAVVSFHLDAGGGTGSLALVTNGLYDPYGKKDSDYALADSILNSLKVNAGIPTRGRQITNTTDYYWPNGKPADHFKNNYYGILNGVTSMIIENCFLDSADYSRYLNTDEKLRIIARADAAGIADYYGLKRYDYKHHWSRPYVETALERGWVAGYDEYHFRPDNVLTRGQCAAIFAKFSPDYTEDEELTATFPDIKGTEYYAKPVAWAQKNGILSGYPNGNFGPDDGVTREQMALIIQKYLAYRGKETNVSEAGWEKMKSFSDASEISAWAQEGVAFCLEQGILEIHRVQLVVELLIVFVCQIGRALLPGRLRVVDDAGLLLLHSLGLLLLRLFGIIGILRLVGLFRRLVHPHALFAKADGDGHKAAVFSQQLEYGLLVEELLAVVGDVQHNAGAALGVLLVLRHGELGVALAAPVDGGFVLVRLGENLHLVGHHKGRIETQSEVANQIFLYVFVFVEEVGGTAEGYLVDILLHLFGGHTDAAVFHREGLLLAVHFHLHGQVAGIALQLAARGQGFQFLGCVDGVGYQFAQKDFVVGIKELLNDRKDVLGLYIQIALHDISFFVFLKYAITPVRGRS